MFCPHLIFKYIVTILLIFPRISTEKVQNIFHANLFRQISISALLASSDPQFLFRACRLHSISVGAKPLSTGQCAPCRRLFLSQDAISCETKKTPSTTVSCREKRPLFIIIGSIIDYINCSVLRTPQSVILSSHNFRSNTPMERYLSPPSGISTTIVFPAYSGLAASTFTAYSAAPEEVPHSTPSVFTRSLHV